MQNNHKKKEEDGIVIIRLGEKFSLEMKNISEESILKLTWIVAGVSVISILVFLVLTCLRI